MAPYYGPNEDPKTIFLERAFVAGDFISGVGYGMEILFYGACARYLWKSRKSQRVSIFLLAYITILLCIKTIFQVSQSYTVQLVYVDNRNYPGGPWQYFLDTQDLPINVVFIASLFSLTFLADLLVVWRCWVIWSASGRMAAYLVMILPVLLLLASFVLGTLWTLQSSQPGLSLYTGDLPIMLGTCYYAVSLGVNIILTVLIIVRLLAYRRTVIKHLPKDHGSEYLSLAAIIIESASLYSIFALIFLITYAVSNPINSVFLPVASSAQIIANYLIIIRFSQGRAWRRNTLETSTALDFTGHPQSMEGEVSMASLTESHDDDEKRITKHA